MNRRSFLQIIAAAAALPFAPKIKLTPGPRRLTFEGFTFIEDPDPLRFILTPEEPYSIEQLETHGEQWRSNILDGWRINPEWETARYEFDGYILRDRFPERGDEQVHSTAIQPVKIPNDLTFTFEPGKFWKK